MALKTQGTHIFIIDPEAEGGPAVLQIQCATSAEGMGGGRDQLDITCLEDLARSSEPGLIAPSTVTMSLNFDPRNESHLRLHELYVDGIKFDLAYGLSDGTSVPTVGTDGMFDLPPDRTFVTTNQTYVADFPLSLPGNAVVTTAMVLQLSGLKTIFPKVS